MNLCHLHLWFNEFLCLTFDVMAIRFSICDSNIQENNECKILTSGAYKITGAPVAVVKGQYSLSGKASSVTL